MSGSVTVGALISGGGRTLINLADHIDRGTLDASIAVVIATRRDLAGVERARGRGLEVLVEEDIPANRDRHDVIADWLASRGVDLVCLCGYLRWFRVDPPHENRVLNIHPALLPEFGGRGMYGLRVHRAVLAAGRPISGCTIHIVDEQYDHGPIVLQRTCPVLPDDDEHTLAARVFREECTAYPEAVQLFAEDRVRVRGERVEVVL